ncbi:4'-phosphopantetheinyl transferase superfamily protein [Streptomyces pactum]|uniref:4'-phosphopantetheinyl transferase superfamily protein n=1 Tax=Streptomyces pactum TaxID=68249 RepID=A0ABS0NLV2_9ACTN|nr:4'-phosphopantetheinyl transferase superfamily protein [Streptomyces pactum]MBH5336156.1 4'-phosphopantetheinyl transferase superfamily protein [Streptomyces pactum]
MPLHDFPEPPAGPLPDGVVRVWWAGTDDADERLCGLLDPVERARHRETAAPADRRRFLLGCAITRVALGGYLGLPPEEVPLVRRCPVCGGPHGKVRLGPVTPPPGDHHAPGRPAPAPGELPACRPAAPCPDTGAPAPDAHAGAPVPAVPRFSVTHSGGLVGVAFHRGGEVGLDAEAVDPGLDVSAIAPGVLTAGELAELDRLPADGRLRGFLRYWCRKEAAVKAVGTGLRTRFRDLGVTPPGAPPAVTAWPGRPATARALHLTDLDVTGSHLACLAVLGRAPAAIVHHRAGPALRRWAATR